MEKKSNKLQDEKDQGSLSKLETRLAVTCAIFFLGVSVTFIYHNIKLESYEADKALELKATGEKNLTPEQKKVLEKATICFDADTKTKLQSCMDALEALKSEAVEK